MVSVCIATHNGDKFIREQLDSILLQLGVDDEVVISDDGSTDKTIDIIREYISRDNRVKLLLFNQGERKLSSNHELVTRNFENAIKNSVGDYIFLSDQDDVWMHNKVRICLDELKDADLVISNLLCVDEHLRSLDQYIYGDTFRFNNFLMLRGKYYGCAMAFRRNVIDYVLPFPKKLALHDFWIGFLTELLGSVKYINIPLIQYRIHNNNTSAQQKGQNSLYFKIKYRFYTMWHLFTRYVRFHNK